MTNLLPGDQPFSPVRLHSLADIALASTRHTRTSFYLSTLFGSSVLTELVTQEMSLLGVCVRHLSGNVINYWWYTTVYEEQLETKFSRETENVFTLSLYYDVDSIGATLPPFL